MSTVTTHSDNFRDHISTVDEEGKRVWLFPKKPKGKLYNYRKLVSYGLLILLFSGPFMRINGLPVFMLNVIERKFIIMGMIFWPQDFFILLLGFLAFIVFIILFTVVYGRVFCGWVCPQTIFLEMVFRRIEYWIEGDFTKQKALSKADWNTEKILKRVSKHSIFLLLSFIIANTFLAYIIGSENLLKIITDNPLNHAGGLVAMVVFTGVFYGVFARFREQVCTIACPYGRLQGVMLDKQSIVVAYDYGRGEPRGKLRKNQERNLGDCIDCNQCVQVCPTGIDIRNGAQQLECTNCTACIDACNNIMNLIEKPEGLIRYATEESIEKGVKWKANARIYAYTAVLFVLVVALVMLLLSRNNIEATVMRAQGQLYQVTNEGLVRNLYNISLINKTNEAKPITLKLIDQDGNVEVIGGNIILPAQGKTEGVFFAEIPENVLKTVNTEITIGVFSNNELITESETKFMAPVK